jgi:tetrahydromethanopterin S-methyltransferase subunit H
MVAGCDGQGISASFVDSRLTSLTYGLGPGGASTVIETLKSKFGKPTEINETGTSATWRNSIGHLDVSEVSLPSGDGHRRYIQTSVVSALNGRGLSKDI